jgi:hypothetical protein
MVLLIGEPIETVAVAGVLGRELIDEAVIDPAREVLVRISGFAGDAEVEILGDSSLLSSRGMVSIFSLPGCGRCLSLTDVIDLLGDAIWEASVCSGSWVVLLGPDCTAGSGTGGFGVAICFSEFFSAFFELGVAGFLDSIGMTGSIIRSIFPGSSIFARTTLDFALSESIGCASVDRPGGA